MKPAVKINLDAIQIAPGFAVLNLSGASGGVRYESTVMSESSQRRHSRRVESRVTKTIDNETIVHEIDAAVKNVDDTIFRHLCVKMTFGHFLPATNHNALHAKVAELRARVVTLNAAAEAMGSRHRGRVGVLTPSLDTSHPDLVRECKLTVLTALGDVRDALRLGDIDDVTIDRGIIRNRLKPALLRAKNIELLVVGQAEEALRAALDRAREVKPEIRAKIAAGASAVAAGQAVNLQVIDRALRLFELG